MGIDVRVAKRLAEDRVDQLGTAAGDEFQLLAEQTRECSQGWIFFYNSADYVRTKNRSQALAGNGPLLVTRDGKLYELPSSEPWQEAVKGFS